MQAAHVAEVAETKRVGHKSGWIPDSVHQLIVEFRDELYFLIVAVGQAARARTLLVEKGFTLPPIQREQSLVAWRNMEEHWDDAARGEPLRAVKQWEADGSSGEPGSKSSYDEDGELLELSGISMSGLRRDLEAVLAAVQDYELDAFDEDWPTPERAAAFMQMELEKFTSLAQWGVARLDWSHRGEGFGLRYRQSDLDEWKARLIAQDDWPPRA